jgi:hypothetical protein
MRHTLAAVIAFAALPLFAGSRHSGRDLTINTEGRERVTQCSQIEVRYDGDRVPVVEEEVSAVRGLRSLSVRPATNGGVYVVGSDDATYSVKACKAAWEGNTSSITTTLRGNELSANIPDDVDAVVYFIVRAPRSSALELQSHNGPISVRDFSGTLNAHTQNGPLSLNDVSGTITADANNGPISFSGSSGVVKIEAYNGPISIKLDGSSFDGTLDVQAHNGPLSLRVPSGYRSGVVVDSNGNGPVSCRAEACRDARRSWDDDNSRHIELGSGATVVRLSVGNGPLSIRD